jgi:hypothetical protein
VKLNELPKDARIRHKRMKEKSFIRYSEGNPYDSEGWYFYVQCTDDLGQTVLVQKGLVILTDADISDEDWELYVKED